MRQLLWAVLVVALVVNVATSFVWDGVFQVLLSVGTGVLVLACATVLVRGHLRERREAESIRR